MFKKPFKQKSQVQLKSSEKKKLGNELKTYFPLLQDSDISLFCNSKDSITKLKVTTFKDENVDIYMVEKVPIFFEVFESNIKLPTVFMVWKCLHAVPTFTTTSNVYDKLRHGADLFFPGVIMEGLSYSPGDFKKNDPVAVNLIENKACIAVGQATIDRVDIFLKDVEPTGKAVKVFHTVGDHLYKLHPEPKYIQLGAPEWMLTESTAEETEETDETDEKEETCHNVRDEVIAEEPEDGIESTPERESQKQTKSESADAGPEEGNQKNQGDAGNKDSEKDKMEQLLEYCFLKGLKAANKSIYPILPATFYANHVLASLPEGESLNIKKTKWKKFSAFLQEKSIEGIIKLQQMQRNEYNIIGVNAGHRRLQQFVDPYKTEPITVEPKTGSDGKPVVQQVFSVSNATHSFFSQFGFKKHDEMTRTDVRTCLNNYIKREDLSHPVMMDKIVVDMTLSQVIKDTGVISRADVLAGLLDKMTVQHKVSICDNPDAIVHKGKMPLIEFEVVMRTGNKKVTLISNLECYGVHVGNFSKELQQKAAASTTVTPIVPGKKGPQLQVQGNQILVAVSILKDKHKINDKFMKGLEKAPKSKKK